MGRILFIGIDYYDYTKEIIVNMERQGYDVTYYPLRLMSTSDRILHTAVPRIFQKKQDRYHLGLFEKERHNHYDIILFIQVHDMSVANLVRLKEMHPESRFILYNWDSIATHDYRPYIPYFDKVMTFDYQDAADYKLGYLPLFGIDKYIRSHCEDNNRIVYFVGNVCHSNRFKTLMAFIKYCKKNNVEFRHHIRCSPIVICKLLCSGIFPRHFSFHKASEAKMRYLLEASTVFDCRNHEQNGYTMRIIENICSGRKVITDNVHLAQEPFYSPEHIWIYEGHDFNGVDRFVNTSSCHTTDYTDLHVTSFVKKLLS